MYHIQAISYKLCPKVIDKVLCYVREHDNQIKHFSLKSPSKLKVNYYLMCHKDQFNLSSEVRIFLKQQFISQFKNLLKNKELNKAVKYLTKLNAYNFRVSDKFHLFSKTGFGVFYYIFGIGYRYLD